MAHLTVVLSLLRLEKYFANKTNSCFGQLTIEYLGHIIFEGVAMDPKKINCILQWRVPKSVKAVRRFFWA